MRRPVGCRPYGAWAACQRCASEHCRDCHRRGTYAQHRSVLSRTAETEIGSDDRHASSHANSTDSPAFVLGNEVRAVSLRRVAEVSEGPPSGVAKVALGPWCGARLARFRLGHRWARRSSRNVAVPHILTVMGQSGAYGRTKLDENGRIVIPASVREELHLKAGDVLTVCVDADTHEVRLRSVRQGIAHAQRLVRQFIPAGVSLVDELIAERHQEAERE